MCPVEWPPPRSFGGSLSCSAGVNIKWQIHQVQMYECVASSPPFLRIRCVIYSDAHADTQTHVHDPSREVRCEHACWPLVWPCLLKCPTAACGAICGSTTATSLQSEERGYFNLSPGYPTHRTNPTTARLKLHQSHGCSPLLKMVQKKQAGQ